MSACWATAYPSPADFRRLLTTLVQHDVEFIVVGGVAALIQGAPMTTFGLDIVPALSGANVAVLAEALPRSGRTENARSWFPTPPRSRREVTNC